MDGEASAASIAALLVGLRIKGETVGEIDGLVLGEQKRLVLNTAHPFYSRVYEPAPEVRAGIEVLLLVMADAELESQEEMRDFYKAARGRWSDRLAFALQALQPDTALADQRAVVAETLHMQVDLSDNE